MSILLAVVLIEVAAFAGFAPWDVDPNGMIRLDPNGPVVNWPGRFEGETYRREGAQIVPWTQETALPSPDNAALLYYQAFLLRPEQDTATHLRISDVLGGGLPDSSIRAYLGKCREMIHTVEVASLVPQCTWGIRHLDPSGPRQTPLPAELRQAGLILATDARTLAVDGHYEAALARCLTLRRMARHTGDETMVMLLASWAFDGLAQRTAQYVLGLMPPHADALRAFRGQLTAVPGTPESLEKTLQSDLELLLASLRRNPDLLDWIRRELAKGASDESTRQEALSLTDDAVLARVRGPYAQFLEGIFRILDSDMPYERKYAELNAWTQECLTRYADDPAGGMWSRNLPEIYSLFVRKTAAYNALKTAIEIYLEYANTGRLPEMLRDYWPKDPFSGQNFEYEITATGFILRCRARDLDVDRIWQYEFSVRE
jgi:hypothetical protein